jgi:two-component system cell cycle sensor histidine kinase/response regulator CckA
MSSRKTVLLVEDKEMVRILIERILTSGGYGVRGTSDASEARAAWDSMNGAVDVLVTDLAMPGLSGRDLAERLRGQRPDLPVLFISGRPPEPSDTLAQGPAPAFLGKPFTAELLLEALRDLLDSAVR